MPSIDGTEFFKSVSVHCTNCCVRNKRCGKVEHFHQMVCASLVSTETGANFPLVMPEKVHRLRLISLVIETTSFSDRVGIIARYGCRQLISRQSWVINRKMVVAASAAISNPRNCVLLKEDNDYLSVSEEVRSGEGIRQMAIHDTP
ncbi:MAG: hypothetical protein J4F49_12515 [Rhodobacteraceae bacterium]|nr:hypothetical protein [Paracoccaceae bacterium]